LSADFEIAVVGCAIHGPHGLDSSSLEESIYTVARAALHDAGLTMDDIDGICVAANDQLDGRAISIMMASGSVGGVDREILSTPSAAEHAFVLASLRIRSGDCRTQLVAAWSPLEVSSTAEALHLGTDPYFHRALPLDEVAANALQAAVLEHSVPGVREAAIDVVRKNRLQGVLAYPDRPLGAVERVWIAGGKPVAWPLTDGMTPPPAYGLVALVLADSQFIDERGVSDVAWIHGTGWATEAGFLGDRDLGCVRGLAEAAAQAYSEAGIEDPAHVFALAEVSDCTPYQELLAWEGLGLCPRERWVASAREGRFALGGATPVNLSGGALSFNPVYCQGLVRVAEAANQARGRAGRHQVKAARQVLAQATSGFAMQCNTVVVMGSERRGASP
jgi:acetyl-CoA C-acetyltransferase